MSTGPGAAGFLPKKAALSGYERSCVTVMLLRA
jgi:hypothetical protein